MTRLNALPLALLTLTLTITSTVVNVDAHVGHNVNARHAHHARVAHANANPNLHYKVQRQEKRQAPTTTTYALTGITAPAGVNVRPLDEISMGMTTAPEGTPTVTYQPGATAPVKGVEGLPAFTNVVSEWPAWDEPPASDSPEVQEWMRELDGVKIPTLRPTVDGSCVNDTEAQSQAAERGWWTCGGHTRDTDITSCPDKGTWGVSFDDGPGAYTTELLTYLQSKSITATFFVTGSRVVQRPDVLRATYMAGHEIAVHTWSHRSLTAMTNEEVVAELGWTRKAIQAVLGVSPTMMRPPFGDIDDRVRAIALAMKMVPVMWSSTAEGVKFDSIDWSAAGGNVPGRTAYVNFVDNVLPLAASLDTGVIVLEHDVFEVEVALAHYFLPAALNHNPPFKVMSIGQCLKLEPENLYVESNKSPTFPPPPPQFAPGEEQPKTTTTKTTGTSGSRQTGAGQIGNADANQEPSGAARIGASWTLGMVSVVLGGLVVGLVL